MPIYKGNTNQGLIYYGSPNTNCLTSVPKNINLSLSNGTLTLKAGSKVYVPNGFESDGTTPKFDEVVIGSDITADTKGYSGLYCYNTAGWFSILSDTVSGSSFDSPSVLQGWYDTANNIIKRYHQQEGWQQPFSFPICKVTSDGTSITSIDQVFDWCGFIGSTAFVLPGVKGLKSNGIKADGTYNNIEVETKSVLLNHYDYPATGQQFGLGGNGNSVWRTNAYYSQPTAPTPTTYSVWHNTTDNFNYHIDADTSTGWVKTADYDFKVVNSISTDSSFKITSLDPTTVQPFPAGIQITNVYKGSTLVYRLAFEPVTFTENGTWTVPTGIKQIRVDCVAAQGWGTKGGKGGRVQCVVNVTPGQVLHVNIGKQHTVYNDGTYDASDIRTDTDDLNSRIVVAGAGGSAAVSKWLGWINSDGGNGGGLTGGSASGTSTTSGVGGTGGTQEAGGNGAYYSMYLSSRTASKGTFALGGAPSSERGGSGYGGAGWDGGGGGVDGYYYAGSSEFGESGAGAGGGSSYTHPTLCSEVVHTQGFQSGNGYVTISMV